MWNGSNDDAARQLSIELAIAQHTGTSPSSYSLNTDGAAHGAARTALWEGGHDQEPEQKADYKKKDAGGDPRQIRDTLNGAPPLPAPRGKPEAVAAHLASAERIHEKKVELAAEPEPVADGADTDVIARPVEEKPTKKTGVPKSPKAKKKKSPATKKKSSANQPTVHPTMDDPVQPITDLEYANLENMMIKFCKVPLLAEFSRPVSLLHPELMGIYNKIVHHPIDLGTVCRKVRRRQYTSLRDVKLDTWRIFSNCVRYHSHPTNKEAVPSFVSIALHLRNYFNDLWQEHMLPSDPPPPAAASSGSKSKAANHSLEQQRQAFAKRKEDRSKRMIVSGLSVMAGKSLQRAAESLLVLLNEGGCVDHLDAVPIWGPNAGEDDEEIKVVLQNLRQLQQKIKDYVADETEYGLDELDQDVRRCYTEDVLENNAALKLRIANRLSRWLGKIVVPIHEATCRGVSQSSIWGCMAAGVWARESSKKPFWPALVLGIMAPEDQREEWHHELTVRNESRLPEKLKVQLTTGKRKAEQAIRKQALGQQEPQSFFLVEFLGTHEFIWVREADIVENFDPWNDPNNYHPAGKKKRSSRSNFANVVGSKMYEHAVEEGRWALEEFELQLQDVGGDTEDEDDGEEGYSFAVLCQSDEEADAEDIQFQERKVDIEECNDLLATDGNIDFSTTGRKNAKKRAQMEKKRKLEAEKKVKADKAKKIKAEQNRKKKDARDKEKAQKLELKELDKKRKKRARERERALKGGEKKRKVEDGLNKTVGRRNLIAGKRERATAIVEGYLNRAIERKHYKTLGLGGVLSIPASLIDSTGLFGMALAFRAAAGEIPMPEDSGDAQALFKPWESIKIDEMKTSRERKDGLAKQVSLLELEIKRVRASTETRRQLVQAVKVGLEAKQTEIISDDKTARENPLKTRKQASTEKKKKKKKSAKAAASPKSKVAGENVPESPDNEDGQDAETAGSPDQDSTMDIEESHDIETVTAHDTARHDSKGDGRALDFGRVEGDSKLADAMEDTPRPAGGAMEIYET